MANIHAPTWKRLMDALAGHQRRSETNPYQRLACAKLQQMVLDAKRPNLSSPGAVAALQARAQHWLKRNHADLEFFCDMAGIDVSVMRERIKALFGAPKARKKPAKLRY